MRHVLDRETRKMSLTLPVDVYVALHRFAKKKVWSDSQAVSVLLEKVLEKKTRAYFKALGVG